jgi:AmiR/NasT family two-component response regulator
VDVTPHNDVTTNGAAALDNSSPLMALLGLLAERNRQLETALQSRIVIEQAKGVLIERFRLDPQQAFDILQRASRSQRRNIHDVSAEIVATRETPPAILVAATALRISATRDRS